mmetsp:Transcript_25062/g.40215  ORF Transcript_25062/g.40215 Transcript_25062/m.40215 type:complete len:293 (-) Transcript_25062:102-980(-)
MLMARRWCRRLRILGSWLFTSRSYRKRFPSPYRDNTARIIPCVTAKLDSNVSGLPDSIFRNVSSFHGMWPLSGGLDLVNLRAFPPLFAAAAAALSSLRRFSTTCGCSWHHTYPLSSNPRRPARPAICWNSRVLRSRTLLPSNLHSCVKSTVRMGTLTPTPRVSVPQMHLSSPLPASFSTSSLYLGSRPAWCTPMPKVMKRLSSLPTGVSNLNPASSTLRAAFSSADRLSVLHRSCARSLAAFCVKWTMYAGVRLEANSSCTESSSGVLRYSNSRGTGRSPPPTTTGARPARF